VAAIQGVGSYMAKHRTIRGGRRRIFAVAAAILTAGAMIFAGASSAGAANLLPIPLTTNASVSTTDGWHGKCAFSVKSVNHTTGVATGHIGAVATVKKNSAYANDVFTKVVCDLYDANAAFLDTATFQIDGPNLPQQRVLVQEPYSPHYIVCITGYVKKHNGTDSGPFSNCSNS
jgi:hypothetical protein